MQKAPPTAHPALRLNDAGQHQGTGAAVRQAPDRQDAGQGGLRCHAQIAHPLPPHGDPRLDCWLACLKSKAAALRCTVAVHARVHAVTRGGLGICPARRSFGGTTLSRGPAWSAHRELPFRA